MTPKIHCNDILTGATLASLVRKAPNCFNLLRQIEVLQRAGNRSTVQMMFEDWGKATAVAKAFSIGKTESAAVAALISQVSHEVRARLTASVRSRGMARFLTHEMIAKGCLNIGFTAATGESEAWGELLTNLPDNKLVPSASFEIYVFRFLFPATVYHCSFS